MIAAPHDSGLLVLTDVGSFAQAKVTSDRQGPSPEEPVRGKSSLCHGSVELLGR